MNNKFIIPLLPEIQDSKLKDFLFGLQQYLKNIAYSGSIITLSKTAKFGVDTSYAEFAEDGTMSLKGNATVWEDLRFPATAINPAGAPSAMVFDTANIGFIAGPSGTSVIAIIAQLPHAWKEGSNIYPHIHWMPTDTDDKNVYWRMEYKWVNVRDVEPALWTTVNIQSAAAGAAMTHQLSSFGAIAGTGKTISSILTIKISRIGGDALDTYTGDALLKEFDIHYEIDANGSKTELSK